MRVFINCDVELGGGAGGAEQFVACLLYGLSQLRSGHEFLLAVWPGQGQWLEPYMSDGMRLVPYPVPTPPQRSALERRIRRALSPSKRKAQALLGRSPEPPPPHPGATSSFVDALEPDVCHFPRHYWIPTAAPSILNLHDLQHLHFPRFFTEEQLEERKSWPEWAARADLLPVHSEWTAHDFVEKLGVPASKVRALPGASPLELLPPASEETVEQTRRQFELPDEFGLYPATTWEHKNHLALAEALAAAGDSHPAIVCTGSKTEGWPRVEAAITRLDLQDRFRFVGFVTPQKLKALYRLATFVIVPSLFEGGGSAAMYESIAEGVPLACSDIPSIPQGVREAALLFDPSSVDSIAGAIRRIVSEPELRQRLLDAGREKAAQYSVVRSAHGYLDLYEELAARSTTRELDHA